MQSLAFIALNVDSPNGYVVDYVTYNDGAELPRTMEQNFGKLVVVQLGGPEREYELNNASITLGRAMTNDIILGDARVSRNHARLECGTSGCTIIDLGTSNGTRLNGNRIEKAKLAANDAITIGNTMLRYEPEAVSDNLEMIMIDTDSDLDLAIDQEVLPMAINATGYPRLVILTSDRTWEVPLENVDSLTLGRAEDNQVSIESSKVSRHHAHLMRKGEIFVLRDLGSTNGTWLHDRQVNEVVLQDGEALRLGNAQLVYKDGFSSEALTIANEHLEKTPVHRPVIFVPGLMGSELWRGSERVWPNVKYLFRHPETYRFSSEPKLEARGIVDEAVIVPNLIKFDQYNRLGDYLVEDLGYERGVDFFEFAYDWRQDVRVSARHLAQMVEGLSLGRPVTLIAHNLGTLVSRYYIECLNGKRRVERVILMGGPHKGVPKALSSLLIAPDVLPFGLMGERLRQVLATFYTSYQILPVYPCATNQRGEKVNLFEMDDWLPEVQRPLLAAAREFHRELGNHTSVPAVSIFGYGLKTISGLSYHRNPKGLMGDLVYWQEPIGDSTIPQTSAVLEGTEIHPVQQYHGSLFVDHDVKMRLKLELTRM
jgi:pSer/pThr/pTyr-binding forkhead associated (FHA) protein